MKLYVGSYAKYNNGSLFGQWIDLDDFSSKDDFISYCFNLHSDENDVELMFQDYECDFDWETKFYSECSISSEYWEIKQELIRLNVDNNLFSAWIGCTGNNPSVDEVQNAIDYFIYKGNLADYLEESFEDSSKDLPRYFQEIFNFIDWEEFARTEELNGTYSVFDNFVFSF